jgi:hypothetical protein
MERGFEKLNSAVFAESSQFGSEGVAAFRTVTSLLMEDKILNRFDALLKTHKTKAYKRARFTTLIFAFSDSADMFCQALVFYYGGTLLAKREYDIVTYFVIYMAAIQGAQAAGTWFSFAPKYVTMAFSSKSSYSPLTVSLRLLPLQIGSFLSDQPKQSLQIIQLQCHLAKELLALSSGT